jgi:hypothetical protein
VTFFVGGGRGISKNIGQDKLSNCKMLSLSFVCTERGEEETECRKMNGISEREVGENVR